MVVPLATDMPFRLDNPMAWKLLNHLSTASRSSSLQRSRISRWRTFRIWESITKLHARRFWQVLLWRFVGLITEGCSKCFCGLGFKHIYPGLKALSVACAQVVCLKASLWAVLLWGFWGVWDKPAASSPPVWCRCSCSRTDILRRPVRPNNPFLSSGYPSNAEELANAALEWWAKKKPPPKAGVPKDQRECVLVSTTWAFLLTRVI